MKVVHLDMGESAHQLLTLCTLGGHKLQTLLKKKFFKKRSFISSLTNIFLFLKIISIKCIDIFFANFHCNLTKILIVTYKTKDFYDDS